MKAPKSKKARKHYENGMTRMPRDEMPLERSSDASPDSLCGVLKQFEKHIQVKENTNESVKELQGKTTMLEKKVEMLENQMQEFKEELRRELNGFKEKLRFEFHEEKRKLEENIENKSSPCFSMLREDLKKESEEVKDEHGLGIQKDIQRQGLNKVHDNNESPSLRSHPHQSQTIKFKLAIQSQVDQVVYKGKPIRTNDCEHITVVLNDGDNPIAPDHPLASAVVQLVLIDGDFDSAPGFWSKDDFEKKLTIRGNNPNLVKNGKFKLTGGKCRHKGVTITDNSNRREVMLGVMIVGNTEERVLEGLSNIFRVQEAKTEKDRGKRNADDSTEDLLRSTTGQVHVPNKNGQGQRYLPTRPNFPSVANPYCAQGQQYQTAGQGQHYQPAGPMLDFMNMQTQLTYGPTAGQGRQHNSGMRTLGAMPPQRTYVPAAAGNGPGGESVVERVTQHNSTQLDNHGYSLVNPLQVGHSQHYATQQGATQFDNYRQGRQHNSGIPTQLNPALMSNLPQREYLLQQNATQQGLQLQNHGQGQQYNIVMPTFSMVPSQGQYVHAAAGNGPGSEPVVQRVPQQNATQQGVQLDNHGSDMGLDLGLSTHNISTGRFGGDVFDNPVDETLRHLNAPDDPKFSGLLHNAVAADQGGPSAGTQWSTSQMHMDYSAGMQLSGLHPPTEDVGSTVTGPRTAAPAPEVTHMDFTQPTPPGLAPWEP